MDATRIPTMRYAYLYLSVVALFSLLHLLRPIDLSYDSVCYLIQAQRLAGFEAPSGWAQVPVCPYPAGYPAALASLLQVGLDLSVTSTLFNLTCIGVGVYFLRRAAIIVMETPSMTTLWPVLLSLNSFVIVRGMTPMLSEPLFLLIQAVVLFLLARIFVAGMTQHTALVVLTFVALLSAVVIRTVGVSLFAAFCWLGLIELRKAWQRPSARKVVTGLMITAVVAGVGVVLYLGRYYINVDLKLRYGGGAVATAVLTAIAGHIREVGEIVANVPSQKLPELFQAPIFVLGVFATVSGAVLLWVRRKRWTIFEPYLLAYAVIIFAWPFYDARFWLPVIPLIAIVVSDEVNFRGLTTRRPVRLVLVAYVLYFLATGTVAHAVNIGRSLNPDWLTVQYSNDPVGQSILTGLGAAHYDGADSAIVGMLLRINP